MNVRTTANYLDIGERSLRRMMSDGRIPEKLIIRIGKKHTGRFGNDGREIRFRKSELDVWIEETSSRGGE